LEASDVLVVSKLDRLGRNAMDVGSTVAKPAAMGGSGPLPGLGRR
jgi:putative DNA-invertase from lambdoid prophage Rac